MLKTDKTCTCGNSTHERTLTENFKFVWECTECHAQSAYRNKASLKKNQKFQEVAVTTPQKKALTKLRKDIIEHDGEGYEFKEFILDSGSQGSIFLTSITGKPDDEGTMDYITARKSRHIFVSERGDLEILSSGGEKITEYQQIISKIS